MGTRLTPFKNLYGLGTYWSQSSQFYTSDLDASATLGGSQASGLGERLCEPLRKPVALPPAGPPPSAHGGPPTHKLHPCHRMEF